MNSFGMQSMQIPFPSLESNRSADQSASGVTSVGQGDAEATGSGDGFYAQLQTAYGESQGENAESGITPDDQLAQQPIQAEPIPVILPISPNGLQVAQQVTAAIQSIAAGDDTAADSVLNAIAADQTFDLPNSSLTNEFTVNRTGLENVNTTQFESESSDPQLGLTQLENAEQVARQAALAESTEQVANVVVGNQVATDDFATMNQLANAQLVSEKFAADGSAVSEQLATADVTPNDSSIVREQTPVVEREQANSLVDATIESPEVATTEVDITTANDGQIANAVAVASQSLPKANANQQVPSSDRERQPAAPAKLNPANSPPAGTPLNDSKPVNTPVPTQTLQLGSPSDQNDASQLKTQAVEGRVENRFGEPNSQTNAPIAVAENVIPRTQGDGSIILDAGAETTPTSVSLNATSWQPLNATLSARPTTDGADQAAAVTSQVAKAIDRAIETNARPLRLRLDPPELGSIAVEVRRDAGQVQIEIRFESSDALRIARNGIDGLRDSLATKGIDIDPDQIRLQIDISRDVKVAGSNASGDRSETEQDAGQRQRQEDGREDPTSKQRDPSGEQNRRSGNDSRQGDQPRHARHSTEDSSDRPIAQKRSAYFDGYSSEASRSIDLTI